MFLLPISGILVRWSACLYIGEMYDPILLCKHSIPELKVLVGHKIVFLQLFFLDENDVLLFLNFANTSFVLLGFLMERKQMVCVNELFVINF